MAPAIVGVNLILAKGAPDYQEIISPLKCNAEGPGCEVDDRTDDYSEGEDEQGHPRSHFPPLFLDDYENIREAGDEQGNRDEAHNNLEVGQKSRARHIEQSRGAVIPP